MKRFLPYIIWTCSVVLAFGLGRWQPTSKDTPTPSSHIAATHTIGDEERLSLLKSVPTNRQQVSNGSETPELTTLSLSKGAMKSLAVKATSDPNPLNRSKAFSKLLETITSENAKQMMETLEASRAGREQRDLLRYAWASIDPEGAMEQALSLDGRQRRDAIENTVTGWASSDPNSAAAWVDAVEDDKDRARFRGSLVSGMADHDIGQATNYVIKLGADGDKMAGRYMESVTREQLRKGTTRESLAWSEGLPDGKLKGQAMDSVAGRYVREDPVGAAVWAERYAGESYAARVIEEVGDEWAERDPEASVAWLQSLPEGKGRSEGMASALDEWADRDARAASEYLVSMQGSPAKDSAVGGFARSIAREDPEAAVAWASTINQEELRMKTLARTAKEWFRRDAEAAGAWLAASGLSEEAQNTLRGRDRRG